jgi:predicted TIM-barrel fold metal-dependent hydrolase
MELIAVKRAKQGMPVHAFAAFDPWRCLQLRRSGVDTLEQLMADLTSGAANGVKVYPPMGFAAAGNAERDETKYPFPQNLIRLTGGRPGPALDSVMDELFDHCVENGIPVMARCGPSNASETNYRDLASPFYWRQALAKNPRRRELRLNLGHFGGIWDLSTGEATQRDWAEEITRLMVDYPHVYADIGYFGSVLHPDEADIVRGTVALIAGQANRSGSTLRNRLMYGSDWSMIGQEPSSSSYANRAVGALASIWSGEQQEDLRWRNAARFLGLGRGDQTRQRLAQLYSRHNLDTTPLVRFDPAT